MVAIWASGFQARQFGRQQFLVNMRLVLLLDGAVCVGVLGIVVCNNVVQQVLDPSPVMGFGAPRNGVDMAILCNGDPSWSKSIVYSCAMIPPNTAVPKPNSQAFGVAHAAFMARRAGTSIGGAACHAAMRHALLDDIFVVHRDRCLLQRRACLSPTQPALAARGWARRRQAPSSGAFCRPTRSRASKLSLARQPAPPAQLCSLLSSQRASIAFAPRILVRADDHSSSPLDTPS